jgi:hypothetical protein
MIVHGGERVVDRTTFNHSEYSVRTQGIEPLCVCYLSLTRLAFLTLLSLQSDMYAFDLEKKEWLGAVRTTTLCLHVIVSTD